MRLSCASTCAAAAHVGLAILRPGGQQVATLARFGRGDLAQQQADLHACVEQRLAAFDHGERAMVSGLVGQQHRDAEQHSRRSREAAAPRGFQRPQE
jgi:hypothetical protein